MRRARATQLTVFIVLFNTGILLVPRLFPRGNAELRVVFLDVGQGDSCVIQTPSGKVIVVDTGNRSLNGQEDMGRRVVAPYLRSQGIQRIEMLLLTHPDTDHIGGADTLLQRFAVGILETNGQDEQAGQKEVVQRAKSREVLVHRAKAGDVMELGDGIKAHVIAPIGEDLNEPTNTHSIVLRLTYGDSSLLLTGDADNKEEERILQKGTLLPTQLMKVGHHGSRTSTAERFLTRIMPRIAVISVGKSNSFGHPAPATLERLQKQGVQVFRTDTQGAITCTSDSKNWTCKPYTRLPQ